MAAMEKGPYLTAAVFCETTIAGQDNSISLIRIIDTVTQRATGTDPPATMPAFIVNSTLVIMLKAGEARGRYSIRLRPEAPDGRNLPEHEQTVQLDGGGHTGINVIIEMQFAVDLEGVYWFDVFFVADKDQERLLTRVPLRVVYEPQKVRS